MRPVFSPFLSHMPMIPILALSFSRLALYSKSNTTIERQKHTVIACHHNSELHSCKEQCWFCCRSKQRKWEANGNAKIIAVMLCSVHRIASICRVYELAATFVHFAPFIYLLFAICSLTTFESISFPHSFFCRARYCSFGRRFHA